MKKLTVVSVITIAVIIVTLLVMYLPKSIERYNYFKDQEKMLIEDIDDEVFSADIDVEELKKFRDELISNGIIISSGKLENIINLSKKVNIERNEDNFYEIKLNVKYRDTNGFVVIVVRWLLGPVLKIKSENINLLIEFKYAWWKTIG